MILSFHPCFDADKQVILGNRSLDYQDLELIKKAKAVVLPQSCSLPLYEACSKSSVPMFPRYEMRFKYPGKTGQKYLFQDFKLNHPFTLCWKSTNEYLEKLASRRGFFHEFPFLIKDDKSHEAEGVFFIKDKNSLLKAINTLSLREQSGLWGFVTQDFIHSEGNVLRSVIMGKSVEAYWKKPNNDGQVLTTLSTGASIDYDWRPDLQEKGKLITRTLAQKTGINMAAVDLVFHINTKDPEPFFLEINYYFGRRGLGGSENYYRLFYKAAQEWLRDRSLNPDSLKLI